MDGFGDPNQQITPNITVPQTRELPKKPRKGLKIFIILAIVATAAIGGFLILQGLNEETEILPSPTSSSLVSEPTSESPPVEEEKVDKKEVSIQVLNGTGIPKEGSFLQTELEKVGFADIKTGNAETKNATSAVVTFSNSLSKSIVNEITQKLEDIYKEVDTKTSTGLDFDVVIVTGVRKGATPKATATPTSKATATPSATTTPTPTSTPTATP